MAKNYFQIPLTPNPQRFTVTLSGITYVFVLKYQNVEEGGWVFDIFDASQNPIVCGVPLVTGANLLDQYPHLGFNGRLWVQNLNTPDEVPTFGNLGTEVIVMWVTG